MLLHGHCALAFFRLCLLNHAFNRFAGGRAFRPCPVLLAPACVRTGRFWLCASFFCYRSEGSRDTRPLNFTSYKGRPLPAFRKPPERLIPLPTGPPRPACPQTPAGDVPHLCRNCLGDVPIIKDAGHLWSNRAKNGEETRQDLAFSRQVVYLLDHCIHNPLKQHYGKTTRPFWF